MSDDRVTHTRGPWCVEAAMSDRAYDIALDYEIPEAGSPILIASTYSDEGEIERPGYISPAEAEANARLMAAAPELLDALRLILPLAKGYAPAGQSDSARRHCNELCDIAETVRAKAEGRS